MPSINFSTGAVVALASVSLGTLLYFIYKKSTQQKDSHKKSRQIQTSKTGSDSQSGGPSESGKNKSLEPHADIGDGVLTSDGYTTLKFNVPKEMIGAIIGRQGANIKKIQTETKTKIDFSKQNDDGPERTITIRGSEKGTQDAELKILHIVYGQPKKDVHIVEVPRKSLGFLIGRGGESIKKLQSDSGCHINIDSNDGKEEEPNADVTLTGSAEEIVAAVAMIDQLLKDWEVKQSKGRYVNPPSKPRRAVSRKPRSAAIFPGSPLPQEEWPNRPDYMECYVTATVNPSHIWVHHLTPAAVKLEEINARLTDLYSNTSELIDDFTSSRPAVGTTVASRSPADGLWYRGKISAYNDDDPRAVAVDVYYVDYGDSNWSPFENYNIQLLRPEFYDLPAQAIECFTDLALNTDLPSDWSEDVCELFEKLSHTGSWKVVMGSLVSHKPKSDDPEDGTLPVIKLVDTNTAVDVHISDEIMAAVANKTNQSNGSIGIPNGSTELANGSKDSEVGAEAKIQSSRNAQLVDSSAELSATTVVRTNTESPLSVIGGRTATYDSESGDEQWD